MNAKEKYQCENCAKTYDEKYDAATCCLPEVCTVWVCGKCNVTRQDEDDANTCCTAAGEVMKQVEKVIAYIGPQIKAVKFYGTEYGLIANGEVQLKWCSKESLDDYLALLAKVNLIKATRVAV